MDTDPITTLIASYHELNTAVIDELNTEPNPLQFMRYVASNRPFVLRRGAVDYAAVNKWDADFLARTLNGKKVRVALTPRGNADAVVEDDHGQLLFVEPYETNESFDDFLDYIRQDSNLSSSERANRNVKYAQPQNDSLRLEYPELFPDVPSYIGFATEALEKDCEAVNFWLGNDRSTTSLHKDNFENIYVQIRGQKHFTLLPPVEMPCVNETPLLFARYQPASDGSGNLRVQANDDNQYIPVPLWDPDWPDVRATKYSNHSKALKVSLDEGDMMYLPAMWYHKVSQGNGNEDFSCSVNYWYDMDFSGSFWTQNAFVRDVCNAQLKAVAYPKLEIEDEVDDASCP